MVYTDCTAFCTAFRSTYRVIQNETTQSVVSRHLELYHYSRALYEAIHFYGREMTKSMTVFHGLNQKMKSEEFTAYFNQPISTTTDLVTAQQFSQGTGIILALKCMMK